MNQFSLKIGILNIMHDKFDTQERYRKLFSKASVDIDLSFFYPKMHYQDRPVPSEVQRISQPLDIEKVKDFDAFIITGAPIEQFAFDQVTYMEEIRCLLNELNKYRIEQLYFCWGAMAAMNYFYGVEKGMLDGKIFGIYPHKITSSNQLLDSIQNGFLAPHARYAEMNHKQIRNDSRLQIDAETEDGDLFLVTAIDHPERVFLFSHLEYDQEALLKEYQREIAAHPEREYKKPENYFTDAENMKEPIFSWENTQAIFIKNWLQKISENKLEEVLA